MSRPTVQRYDRVAIPSDHAIIKEFTMIGGIEYAVLSFHEILVPCKELAWVGDKTEWQLV